MIIKQADSIAISTEAISNSSEFAINSSPDPFSFVQKGNMATLAVVLVNQSELDLLYQQLSAHVAYAESWVIS